MFKITFQFTLHFKNGMPYLRQNPGNQEWAIHVYLFRNDKIVDWWQWVGIHACRDNKEKYRNCVQVKEENKEIFHINDHAAV